MRTPFRPINPGLKMRAMHEESRMSVVRRARSDVNSMQTAVAIAAERVHMFEKAAQRVTEDCRQALQQGGLYECEMTMNGRKVYVQRDQSIPPHQEDYGARMTAIMMQDSLSRSDSVCFPLDDPTEGMA